VKNSSLEKILIVMLTQLEGFKRVHGGIGYGEQNQEGEDILNFAIVYDLMVAKTFFRKKKSHLITFSSGQHSSQIDFLLTRREERLNYMDCKVIAGECVVTQHKLLVADFCFQVCVRRYRRMKITRTRWWKLKGMTWEEAIKRDLKEWNIPKKLALDRSAWKMAIHIPEP
jgi:hypothetical protein